MLCFNEKVYCWDQFLILSKLKILMHFNVEKLMRIFPNLPKIIWSNEIITKMHDSLPLVLFCPSNFVHLLETHNFVEAAYWMTISLSILAFNGNEIGFSNRMFILQICFYFLVFYYEQKINTKNIELHETKKSGKNLQFYSIVGGQKSVLGT